MPKITRYTKIINVDAINSNIGVVKKYRPNSKILGIVKSNAYGHGIKEVYPAVQQCDGLGVSDFLEGALIRKLGYKGIVVLLNGFHSREELDFCGLHDFTPVIHNAMQLELLESVKSPLTIWIKVDTGMNRLGFHVDELKDVMQKISKIPLANLKVVMSHLHSADKLHSDYTKQQYASFKNALTDYHIETSMVNSAGLLGYALTDDWVRPGLMLYGASPISGKRGVDFGLQPVMTLASKVIQIRDCRIGDTIGYGADYVCQSPMKIGIIPVGYGDGYPQMAASKTGILVNGQLSHLVGRVSMEKLAVDLTDIADSHGEYYVQLWGDRLPVEEVAKNSHKSVYELFCNMRSV